MRTLHVDFNRTLADGRLVASRRRVGDVSVGERVFLADAGDDATYEARVVSVEARSVSFTVDWEQHNRPAFNPVVSVVASQGVITRPASRAVRMPSPAAVA